MQTKRLLQALTTLLAVATGGTAVAGDAEDAPGYVFGWPFVEWEEMQPRGGDTRGPEVDVVERTTEDFRRLQAERVPGTEYETGCSAWNKYTGSGTSEALGHRPGRSKNDQA